MRSAEIARKVFFQHVEGARDLWPLVERYLPRAPPPLPSDPFDGCGFICCFCLQLKRDQRDSYLMVCYIERGIDDVPLRACRNCYGLMFDVYRRSHVLCAWHRE